MKKKNLNLNHNQIVYNKHTTNQMLMILVHIEEFQELNSKYKQQKKHE